MTKTPVSDSAEPERRDADGTPPDLYWAPSFKHRHEIRAPLASGDDAYYRAYPQFAPRRVSTRRVRRRAIRGGG